MSPETIDWLHGIVRKSAHVTEYAVFALLVARALMGSSRPLLARGWFAMSCLLLTTLAVTDEYHQSFVASRTPAVTDVLIDTSGGFAALAALALWRQARNARLEQFDSVAFFREQRSEPLWDFDIKDQEKAVVVRFASPGFDPASLDVNLQGNLLILHACMQIEKKAKDRDSDELGFRELYRCVPLPSPADAAKATATYCDGMLTVSLPKTDRNKVGRILVEVSHIRQPPRAVEVARAVPRRLRNDLAPWPRPTLKPAVNSAARNHAVPKNRFG